MNCNTISDPCDQTGLDFGKAALPFPFWQTKLLMIQTEQVDLLDK
jgi:hypothetical protein